jgi:hypothetical protein
VRTLAAPVPDPGVMRCRHTPRGERLVPLTVTYQMIRDAAQAAKTEAEKLKNQPLLQAILELQGMAFELQGENAELRREADDLKREKDRKAGYRLEANVWWTDDPRRPGPFCPACMGSGKEVALYSEEGAEYRHCPACNAAIPIPGAARPDYGDDMPPPRKRMY